MTLDDLRSKSLAVTEPLAAVAMAAGASPNLISILSMIFALAAGGSTIYRQRTHPSSTWQP